MIVSWNGRLVKEGVVSLAVNDPLFLRGEGVFETVRVEEGKPRLWERHYERLGRSAARMGWVVPESGCLLGQIEELVVANGLASARVRITLGKEVLMTAVALPDEVEVATAITSDCPVNERSPLAQVKCTSYAENIVLLRESGVDEVIRANTLGELCEGCLSNVFFVKEGRIYTPSLDSGCLPGVMRAHLMSRVEVEEGRWAIEILKEAEEVWLSNAIRGLRSLSVLDGRKLEGASALFKRVRESLELREAQ